MGSLDIAGAKRQFLELVDALNAGHLPGFTIWLDSKLAEYKVNGVILPDSAEARDQQYPEWISRSLRRNLSFIFHGDSSAQNSSVTDMPKNRFGTKRHSEDNSYSAEEKVRKLRGSDEWNRIPVVETPQTTGSNDSDISIIVKVEAENDREMDSVFLNADSSISRPKPVETPMPRIDESFSLVKATLPHRETNSEIGERGMFTQSSFVQSAAIPRQDIAAAQNSIVEVGSGSHQLSRPVEPNHPAASYGSLADRTASADHVHGHGHQKWSVGTDEGGQKSSSGASSMFTCNICSKVYGSRFTLTRHKIKHAEEKHFPCPYCPKKFSRLDGNYSHQRIIHCDQPLVTLRPRRKK